METCCVCTIIRVFERNWRWAFILGRFAKNLMSARTALRWISVFSGNTTQGPCITIHTEVVWYVDISRGVSSVDWVHFLEQWHELISYFVPASFSWLVLEMPSLLDMCLRRIKPSAKQWFVASSRLFVALVGVVLPCCACIGHVLLAISHNCWVGANIGEQRRGRLLPRDPTYCSSLSQTWVLTKTHWGAGQSGCWGVHCLASQHGETGAPKISCLGDTVASHHWAG